MGIIFHVTTKLREVEELATNYVVSGKAGLLLQLLESHPRAPSSSFNAINLARSSKHYMIEQGPAGFFLEINVTPPAEMLFFLFAHLYTGLSS